MNKGDRAKRVLSLLLTLCLCLAMLLSMIIKTYATTLSEAEFATKIAELLKTYRDGEYWNAYNACGYEGTCTAKCPQCSNAYSYSLSCGDKCGKSIILDRN